MTMNTQNQTICLKVWLF